MMRQYRDIERGELLVAGYDMATGVKDYCAVVFLSKKNFDVPLVIHSDQTASIVTNNVSIVLEKIFDVTGIKPIIAPETNNGGVYEIDRLQAMNRLNKYEIWQQPRGIGMIDTSTPSRYGWTTTTANRGKMLSDLKQGIDGKVIKVYDKKIISELYSFVIVKLGSIWKAQAETNSHDDLVMSLAISYQLFLSDDIKVNKGDSYENIIKELPREEWRDRPFY